MATVQTYTKTGNKATTAAKLDKAVFGIEVTNHELLKQAYVAYLANGRQGDARTMTRGLIRGGGKKPWRQKGTGRARFGSSRNPIWRGGGIVFGPTGEENYTHHISTKMKRQAIRQALSLAANEGRVKVIEEFTSKDGKTKDAAGFLKKIEATGNVLIIVDTKNDEATRAINNLRDVRMVTARYVTVYDLLNADAVVVTQKALDGIHEWLGNTAPKAEKEAK